MKTFIFFALTVAFANAITKYTPLIIDKHPCQAKNLKHATTYICNSEGDVQCINGWEMDPWENPSTPCSRPICNPDCGVNGECRAPNYCACDVGWDGRNCTKCIDLPGCMHGSCDEDGVSAALACKCETGWEGGLCDVPTCNSTCVHGHCVQGSVGAPNYCDCFDGWTGISCDTCVPQAGCVNGNCTNPATSLGVGQGCYCHDGYKGALCDQPDCSEYNDCSSKGKCVMAGGVLLCACDLGYSGTNCTMCQPQPNDCPTAMCDSNQPWSCP